MSAEKTWVQGKMDEIFRNNQRKVVNGAPEFFELTENDLEVHLKEAIEYGRDDIRKLLKYAGKMALDIDMLFKATPLTLSDRLKTLWNDFEEYNAAIKRRVQESEEKDG